MVIADAVHFRRTPVVSVVAPQLFCRLESKDGATWSVVDGLVRIDVCLPAGALRDYPAVVVPSIVKVVNRRAASGALCFAVFECEGTHLVTTVGTVLARCLLPRPCAKAISQLY